MCVGRAEVAAARPAIPKRLSRAAPVAIALPSAALGRDRADSVLPVASPRLGLAIPATRAPARPSDVSRMESHQHALAGAVRRHHRARRSIVSGDIPRGAAAHDWLSDRGRVGTEEPGAEADHRSRPISPPPIRRKARRFKKCTPATRSTRGRPLSGPTVGRVWRASRPHRGFPHRDLKALGGP